MHRCSCSTRALEAFTKDFAAINLRQPRARIVSRHRRAFGAISSSRQLQPNRVDVTDNAFDPTATFGASLNEHKLDAGPAERRIEDERVDIDIDPPAGPFQSDFVESETTESMSVRAVPSANDVKRNSQATILKLPAISQHLSKPTPFAQSTPSVDRTRAENRRLRMLRRIQQGTYRAAAESRKATASEQARGNLQELSTSQSKDDLLDTASQTVDELDSSPVSGPKQSSKSVTVNSKAASSKKPSTVKVARTATVPTRGNDQAKKSKRERWMIEKDALEKKFGERGWQPRKRLSPDTLEGLRALHASDPSTYTTPVLAEHFEVTPEAIRRILKSKWKPNTEEIEDRMQRWEKRGLKKWGEMAAQGIKPPKKWRELGAGNPLVQKKVEKRKKTRAEAAEAKWKEIEEQAQRLPFEASLAERIL